MFICFFDTEGIMHKKFVPPGWWMKNSIAKFWCEWGKTDKWHISWALHHDNAPAQALLIVWQFLASMNMTVIPHPPYSSNLAPCDFFCSQRWNWSSKSNVLTKMKISRTAQNVKTLMRSNFQQCFWSWKSCWDRCINADGDYFEGDGDE